MAIITISNTGGNWNSTTTWVGGVVPGAADDVVATATSGPLTVNVASSCKSIVLTNYTSTLTLNALLDVFGTVTFVPSMSVAGTNQLRFNTTATLTSGGLTIPWSLLWGGTSQTFTLGDVWNCSGPNSFGGTTSLTINGNQIVSTNTFNIGGSGIAGTTTLVMTGTGAIQGAGIVSCNLIFNSPSGTITIGSSGSPNLRFSTGVLTYSAGTIVYGSVTGGLSVAGSCTINTSGITWQNVIFNAANTTTLTSSLNVTGNTTISSATVINGTGTTLNVGGNITVNQPISGNAPMIMNGTGTWSSAAAGVIQNNLTINTSGTITISGNVYYNTGTLTYTSGTVVTTGSNIIHQNANTTLNTNGISWNNVTFQGTGTYTLSSNISCINLNLGSGSATVINGNKILVSGNLNATVSLTVGGTTIIEMNGTGTYSHTSTGALRNPIVINTTGTTTISGNVYYNTGTFTYTAGSVITTGSTLNSTVSTTFNTSGMIWNNVTLGGTSQTYTLTSNLNLSGNLTFNGATLISISGAFNVNVGGDLTVTTNATSSSPITLNGTGTWSGAATITTDININTSGTITLSGTVRFQNGTLKYITGTVVTAGSTLLASNTVIYDTSGSTSPSATTTSSTGINFNNVTFTTAAVITNNSPLTIIGTLTINTGNPTINGSTFYLNGSLTSTTSPTGTALLILQGTGTWSGTGAVRNNMTINTSGTITISGTVAYTTGTLTYTAGTVITTGTTLSTGTCTLNTNGITWNNFLLSVGGTITLTSNLTIGGNYTLTSGTQSWNNGVNSVSINGDMILGTLTYISTASFVFNVPNNLTINNLTLYTTAVNSSSTNNCQINGLYTININGSLTTTTASFWVGFISGNSTLKMTGTGTLFTVYGACIGNPLVIDTTGTITFGSTVSVGGSSFTYVKGGILNDRSCTLQIMLGQTMGLGKSIVFANIAQGYATQAIAWPIGVTLTNDLATLGTYSTGTFAPINLTPIDGAGYYLYVGGFNNSRTTSGTATIVFRYSGTWASSAYLTNNIIVDTTGTLTWGNTSYYQSGIITFIRGNFSSNPWFLYQNMTLIDVDKVIIPNVVITAGLTITINKMFTGSPTLKSTISSTTTTNYTLSFNDRTEKFSKFIRISNATCQIPGQLTVITKSGNRGNNVGISFYPNQKPNGFAKNSPSVTNTQTYGFGGILADPIFN